MADNWRVRWMTGYYYKVINEDNRRVTVGLNNMLWHYDKDPSGYTRARAATIARRSIFRSRYRSLASAYGKLVMGTGDPSLVALAYQNHAALSVAEFDSLGLSGRCQSVDGTRQRSRGFGYTARALVERRVTGNWFVGAAVDIQQAKDYTPSHALLYVRYSAAGWQG